MGYALKIAISLFPVALFFIFYFRNFIFQRDVFRLSRAFFFGMLMSSGALAIQLLLPRTSSDFVRAFVHAALVEESLRVAIIAVMIKRGDDTFTVTEGIFRSILIGLGFAFAENLHYALTHDGFVILLRTVSAVPMHVFCSAMIGSSLAYAHHCSIPDIDDRPARKRRLWLYAGAVALPVAYHTAFDFILFAGGSAQRILPLLLAGGFIYVEYLNARGRIVVPRNVLGVLSVDADDMDIVTRQRQYESWLEERQAVDATRAPLFRAKFTGFHLALAIVLLAFAVCGALGLHVRPDLFLRDGSLDLEVLLALLVTLPGSAGLVLLLNDRLNYLFFRENLLRLPHAVMAVLHTPDRKTDTVALDLFSQGVFLTGVSDVPVATAVTVEFVRQSGTRATAPGLVRWSNDSQPNLPRGCVVRFLGAGWAFRFFWVRHRLRRLRTGLLLMLRPQRRADAVPE